MVVKAKPGTREREPCEQRVKWDKGGYQRGRDEKSENRERKTLRPSQD